MTARGGRIPSSSCVPCGAAVCARLPDCEHVTVEGARHEILMETDERRAEFWDGFERMLKRADI